ncbi:MAG: signal peptidase I [Deltaproteobacteria bacterium]|nr:signal peptidase I [Deltaproteobacteria bacterium]MBW2258442.1 signal peptidase I [Deltaproteobacteria bacterium]
MRETGEDDDIDDDRPTSARTKKPEAAKTDETEDESRGLMGVIRELFRTWGPAILAVILIRTFIFEPYRIPSGSMVPTLLIGDHVLVSKYSYGIWLPFTETELVDLGDPERGDILVFRFPRDPRLTYIKRVVAIRGDKLRVRNNRLYINNEPQPAVPDGTFEFIDDQCRHIPSQAYVETLSGLPHTMLTSGTGTGGRLSDYPEITVPEGKVFVMGDNRDHSEDSRAWGFVREDQIKGKAHFVWFSWDSCTGKFGSIRGSRWFTGLYK